jgi:hypothetical protein
VVIQPRPPLSRSSESSRGDRHSSENLVSVCKGTVNGPNEEEMTAGGVDYDLSPLSVITERRSEGRGRGLPGGRAGTCKGRGLGGSTVHLWT